MDMVIERTGADEANARVVQFRGTERGKRTQQNASTDQVDVLFPR
jgi:hypothetical protein